MRLALALLALVALARADMPREDLWYERFVDGKKIGWGHHTLQRVTRDGSPAWLMRYDGEDRAKDEGVEESVRSHHDVLYTLEFVPIHESYRHQDGEQVTLHDAFVREGKAHFVRTINERKEERDIDLAGRKPHDPVGPYLAGLGLRPGDVVRDATTESASMQVSDVTMTAEARETVSAAGGEFDCLRIRYEESLFPGVKLFLWVRDDGVIVQEKRASFTRLLSTKAEASRPMESAELGKEPPIRPVFYFPGRFDEATFAVDLGGDPVEGLFAEGPYQRVAGGKGSLRVTLLPQPAPEGKTIPFPVRDPALAEWLNPTPVLCLDDPAVRAKAKEAIGHEKDALAAARKACHWVHANIAQEISRVASMTAKETLTEGKGDCNELSVLFAAFCRVEGIPARLVHGLLWAGDEFGYHQWAEVWAGKWVPVDPTRDLVGIPPAFLLLGIADGGKDEAEGGARATRLHYRASFTLVSVKVDGKERTVTENDARFRKEGPKAESYGWGVGFTVPRGWTQTMSKSGRMVYLNSAGFAHADLWPVSMSGPMTRELAHRGAERMRDSLDGGRIVCEEVREEADRRIFSCEVMGTSRGNPSRGRTVCIESRGRLFVARFFANDGKEFDDQVPSFDAFLDSLEFP